MWQKMLQMGNGSGGSLKTYATLDIKTQDSELVGKTVNITFENPAYEIQPVKFSSVLSADGFYHAPEVRVQSFGEYTISSEGTSETVVINEFNTITVLLSLWGGYLFDGINNKGFEKSPISSVQYIYVNPSPATLNITDSKITMRGEYKAGTKAEFCVSSDVKFNRKDYTKLRIQGNYNHGGTNTYSGKIYVSLDENTPSMKTLDNLVFTSNKNNASEVVNVVVDLTKYDNSKDYYLAIVMSAGEAGSHNILEVTNIQLEK